ncbi:UNVERIFIED_CONTAM: hypothetical protein Scaly_1620800 [Sesamum calycinum]|uniref:Uncharacterized protein n=1 Tax=Sesamum calycinum TaxID=2727403 RepID=A0AAW2P9X6_9LAMI
MPEYYNWTSHGEEIVQEYFKAPTVPPLSEERTPAGHVEGNYPQEDIPDDGMRSCLLTPVLVYIVRGGGPYDYEQSWLADHFYNIVRATDHPLWDGCIQSQLSVVAELVDIKTDGHISDRMYNRISHWANRILSPNHTLPEDYYSTKKLVKDLGLFIEKISHVRMIVCCTGRTTSIWSTANSVGTLGTSLPEGETHAGRSPRMMSLEEPCNVRLGLCKDGFAPHGVRTYDHATDSAFHMRAALMLIVNDLPAYDMASRWSTAGVMGCPACMDDIRAFHLQNKQTFTKYRVENKVARSRLTGDQLLDRVTNISPAVKMPLPLPVGYVMDIKKNIKDNTNARRNLKIICNCPELELDKYRPNIMSIAVYILAKEQKRRVCEWIRGLKFPDGYASNLACFVDMTELRMHSLKSHDYHVHPELNYTDKELLKYHYWGPSAEVTSVPCYFVNGYNFQTEHHNTDKSTMNYGAAGTSRRQVHENDDENYDGDDDSDRDDETDDDEYEAT